MTHATLFLMKSHGRYKEYYKENNVTYVIHTSVNNRFIDCENFILKFKLIFSDENYSNFMVLKLQNHFQEISLIKGFPKTSRACPNFPEILVFILLNFL
jgi:hypothetical protein